MLDTGKAAVGMAWPRPKRQSQTATSLSFPARPWIQWQSSARTKLPLALPDALKPAHASWLWGTEPAAAETALTYKTTLC